MRCTVQSSNCLTFIVLALLRSNISFRLTFLSAHCLPLRDLIFNTWKYYKILKIRAQILLLCQRFSERKKYPKDVFPFLLAGLVQIQTHTQRRLKLDPGRSGRPSTGAWRFVLFLWCFLMFLRRWISNVSTAMLTLNAWTSDLESVLGVFKATGLLSFSSLRLHHLRPIFYFPFKVFPIRRKLWECIDLWRNYLKYDERLQRRLPPFFV